MTNEGMAELAAWLIFAIMMVRILVWLFWPKAPHPLALKTRDERNPMTDGCEMDRDDDLRPKVAVVWPRARFDEGGRP